jgi:hypothetical protein
MACVLPDLVNKREMRILFRSWMTSVDLGHRETYASSRERVVFFESQVLLLLSDRAIARSLVM